MLRPAKLLSADRWASASEWVGFFLILAGVRLWLVANFGSSLPIVDQWDAEWATLFKPWLEGTLRLGDLFQPHNEHRIVTSRLLFLSLLHINGQWDCRVEMAVNAVLAASLAAGLAAAVLTLWRGANRAIVFGAIGCWSAFPVGWENTLWGFQSAFYLLTILSLLTIWGLACERPFSARWWIGATALVLASLSMASGFLAAAAVIGLLALRLITGRTSPRGSYPTAILCVATIAISLISRTDVAAHSALKATSLSAWLHVVAKCLAWPFPHPAACFILYLPLLLLLCSCLNRNPSSPWFRPLSPLAAATLALGAWVVLQAAAIAYARGSWEAHHLSSRYLDVLGLGVVANLFAAVELARQYASASLASKLAPVAAALWTGAAFAGLATATLPAAGMVKGRAEAVRKAENDVRTYVATADVRHLEIAPGAAIPYVDSGRLASLLQDPLLRRILPAAVREPLLLEPEAGREGPFHVAPAQSRPNALSYRRIWSSDAADPKSGPGRMESKVLRPALPYVHFMIAGPLGAGMSLHVHGEANEKNKRLRPWPRRGGAEWRDGYVAVPDEAIRVIARDENLTASYAFQEPTEVGRLSFWTEHLLRASTSVVVCGAALIVAAAALRVATPRPA